MEAEVQNEIIKKLEKYQVFKADMTFICVSITQSFKGFKFNAEEYKILCFHELDLEKVWSNQTNPNFVQNQLRQSWHVLVTCKSMLNIKTRKKYCNKADMPSIPYN